MLQLQDYRQVNSSTDAVENALPLELTSNEYNALSTSTEKKVKPPAVPPKTYLEPKAETKGEIETPSDEVAQSDNGDLDTCSVGSDSLYNMKLEKIDFQLQKRVAPAASVPPRATIIQRDKNLIPPRNVPRIRAMSTGPQVSLKSVCIIKEERVDHERKHRSDSKESDYQKLDSKKFAPPNRYDDLQNFPSKPQHDKATRSQHASTGQESQYEPLRLKTMNKESIYQEIGPKETH